jgi:hypothetical protein
MPWEDEIRHYKGRGCDGKTTKSRSEKGGFCEAHHEWCPIHTQWYHYTGESCDHCDKAERREIVAARKEKKAKKKKELEEEEGIRRRRRN